MATTEPLRIEVVHAWPDRCWRVLVVVPAGSRVSDALQAVSPALAAEGLDLAGLGLAVFGHSAGPATRLRDGDRVELLRPLQASPREARASRAAAAKRRGA